MSEYIKREDALKLLRGSAVAKYPASFYVGIQAAAQELENVPAADVVPVVRCKDCEHFIEKGGILEPWCDWNEARLFDGDGFCSDGKRKDGDGNG